SFAFGAGHVDAETGSLRPGGRRRHVSSGVCCSRRSSIGTAVVGPLQLGKRTGKTKAPSRKEGDPSIYWGTRTNLQSGRSHLAKQRVWAGGPGPGGLAGGVRSPCPPSLLVPLSTG